MISQEKLQGAGGARATGFLSDSRDLSRIVDSQKSRTQAQRSNQGVAQGSQAVFKELQNKQADAINRHPDKPVS